MRRSFLHSAYLAASHITGPVFARAQRRALAAGKENPDRSAERWGQVGVARPNGRLVWFHAASVGETQSILPLIDAVLDAHADVTVLVTSTTLTSAHMLAVALPPRAIHQMAPYDTAAATRAFLDHWAPDVAIWVESELWPRMLHEARARDIPRLFLNARISERTMRRWRNLPATAKSVLVAFDTIHVQENATAQAMRDVGVDADTIVITGSLKQDRPPLSHDPAELAALLAQVGGRSVWCASSTHDGEDGVVLDAHAKTGGLLILVPRHTERARDIASLARARGFKTALRSNGDLVVPDTDVYIADTMGELGLWYRAAPVSFVGGSLAAVGGHNPYEPALLGSAVVHGPHVGNFKSIYDQLDGAGAATQIVDAETLAQAVVRLSGDGGAQADRARPIVGAGQGTTQAALSAITGHLAR